MGPGRTSTSGRVRRLLASGQALLDLRMPELIRGAHLAQDS